MKIRNLISYLILPFRILFWFGWEFKKKGNDKND